MWWGRFPRSLSSPALLKSRSRWGRRILACAGGGQRGIARAARVLHSLVVDRDVLAAGWTAGSWDRLRWGLAAGSPRLRLLTTCCRPAAVPPSGSACLVAAPGSARGSFTQLLARRAPSSYKKLTQNNCPPAAGGCAEGGGGLCAAARRHRWVVWRAGVCCRLARTLRQVLARVAAAAAESQLSQPLPHA